MKDEFSGLMVTIQWIAVLEQNQWQGCTDMEKHHALSLVVYLLGTCTYELFIRFLDWSQKSSNFVNIDNYLLLHASTERTNRFISKIMFSQHKRMFTIFNAAQSTPTNSLHRRPTNIPFNVVTNKTVSSYCGHTHTHIHKAIQKCSFTFRQVEVGNKPL